MRSDKSRPRRIGNDPAPMRRRDFLAIGAVSATALGAAPSAFKTDAAQSGATKGGPEMYRLIGEMTSLPGKRDELIAILVNATCKMPGCLSYIIAKDATDADAIWITEA